MVSKMNLNSVLLIGGVALGGYALYRYFNASSKGITNATAGLGAGIGKIGTETGDFFENTIGEIGETFGAIQNKIQAVVTGDNSTNKEVLSNNSQINISPSSYVSKVETTGSAYGMKTSKVTLSTGKTQTIINAPNKYYSNLGIGFDSKGNGYSSAFAGNTPISNKFTNAGFK